MANYLNSKNTDISNKLKEMKQFKNLVSMLHLSLKWYQIYYQLLVIYQIPIHAL